MKAGVRDVVVAFVDRSHAETGELLEKLQGYGGLTGSQAPTDRRAHLVDGVEVAGPFDPKGVSRTPSRALIFICDPRKSAQGEGSVVRGDNKDEPACAKQITENLARRAFRRPVTADDMKRLMPFYEAGRKDGGSFDQGIEQVGRIGQSLCDPVGTDDGEAVAREEEFGVEVPDEQAEKLLTVGDVTKYIEDNQK